VSQTVSNLTHIEQLALGYIKVDKEVRNEITPGEKQPVDFTVRIQGHVTVQPDVQGKTPSHKIPWMVVVAELLNRMGGESRDKAVAMLTQSIRSALEKDKKARDTLLEDWPDLKDPTDALQGLLKETLTPSMQKGGVLPELDISLVEEVTNQDTVPQPEDAAASKTA
jgi:hypothetical protein